MNDDLAKIRALAQDRLDALQEPPWASRRYQHLVALLDDMLSTRQPHSHCSGGDNVVPFRRSRR